MQRHHEVARKEIEPYRRYGQLESTGWHEEDDDDDTQIRPR